MNTQLNDKIHAAFEPIKEAVEEKGEYAGAVLAVTYGTTRNDSQIWFEEAGNVCAWRAVSYRSGFFAPYADPGAPHLPLFEPYREMHKAGEIFAAVLTFAPDDNLIRDMIGNGWACGWLMEQHKMHVETVVKTQMAMTMNQIMQQQAQAAFMAEQLSKGKIIGRGNGGLGRG